MSKRGATRMAVYEYISKRLSDGGSAPTVRDICSALKLKSTSTAHLHIDNLRNDGYIDFDDKLQRTIRLTDKIPAGAKVKPNKAEASNVSIPLIGTVAAGEPIYAFDDIQDAYSLPKELLRSADPAETFMLTVDGESMIDAGILTDDKLIVTKSFGIKDGDIAAARVNGDSATVKRIFFEGPNIRLQPENKDMEPIICPASSVEIIGKVIGLLRSY